jgi:hypothetical protein
MSADGRIVEMVLLDAEASPEEVAGVREAFARADLAPEVEAGYERKADPITLLPWAILIILLIPIKNFLGGFGTRFGERTADDVYDALGARDLVRRRGLVVDEPSVASEPGLKRDGRVVRRAGVRRDALRDPVDATVVSCKRVRRPEERVH